MILIGMFDSPFVRRVAVALDLYGMAFEHKDWSVFRQADEISAYNPLRRVPTLVLDDGTVLVETLAILDTLDEMAGDEKRLSPKRGVERRRVLQVCALAGGAAEKMVALVYERAVHDRATPSWEQRCKTQIEDVLDHLEAVAAGRTSKWLEGERLTHADIAVATALTFMDDAAPELSDPARWRHLQSLRDACEAMSAFADHHRSFLAPPPRST